LAGLGDTLVDVRGWWPVGLQAVGMAEPVRVRRLSDHEGQRLQQIVRRGTGSPIRLRRAMVVLASAGGNTVPAIARLVQADEDSVRQVIHRFNEMGLPSLDPRWAGGSPRLITSDDEAFIVATATTRPEALGAPLTRWSVRKLADWLAHNRGTRRVGIGRERLRQLLHKHEITFQRTKTWKESTDAQREAKLARIEEVTAAFRDRVFAFDEFGPLAIRPHAGADWTPKGHPGRLPANYHKLHGVRQFHGCYSVGEDTLWGVVHRQKSAANTLAALKSIRAVLTRALQAYLRWRNTNARHPDVLAAQRRERARIRSERQRRWGQLFALGIGEDDPGLLARLSDVDTAGTQRQDPLDLIGSILHAGGQIEAQAALASCGMGTTGILP